ncbi:Actin family [Rhypophila decipiens]
MRPDVMVGTSDAASSVDVRRTLVLDNGGDTIKAGFVTSTTDTSLEKPRVIPNYIVRDRHKKVYVASEFDKCKDFSEIGYRHPVEKGYIVNWEAQKEIWDREFFNDNAPQPCDPSETRLILTEQPNALPQLQTHCDQIVFELYGFSSYYRGICPTFNAYHDVQAIFQTPRDVGTRVNLPAQILLLIDSGYSHTTVTPILAGRPLQSAIRRLDIGGRILTNRLTRLLSERHFDMRHEPYVVNEMKEKACYASLDFKSDLEKTWKGTQGEHRPDYVSGGGIAKDYILPDSHTRFHGIVQDYEPGRVAQAKKGGISNEDIVTLRNERFAVPELLFNPSDIKLRQPGIPGVVMQSLSALPLGLWGGFLANIVVVGGNTLFEGFAKRLEDELTLLVPSACRVRVARPTDPITNTWEGAANFAKHEHANKLAVTKAEYDEYGSGWVARKLAAGLGVPNNGTAKAAEEGQAGPS